MQTDWESPLLQDGEDVNYRRRFCLDNQSTNGGGLSSPPSAPWPSRSTARLPAGAAALVPSCALYRRSCSRPHPGQPGTTPPHCDAAAVDRQASMIQYWVRAWEMGSFLFAF